MRKLKLLLASILLGQAVFAGGIVTNTNQSAAYIRMLARDASTDVDAVFYNPAGLTKLQDGFYLQFNSQTISQSRTITSSFPGLNSDTYEGSTFVPVFPTLFATYKTGDWAFSGGVTVIGGGGSSTFDKGLPSFEQNYAIITPALADLQDLGYNVSGYSTDIDFQGSSMYIGGQATASYKINENISVFAGARYVSISNTYEGSISNVQLEVNGVMTPATEAFASFAGTFNGLAAQTKGAGDMMQPLIDGGAGTFTLDQLLGAGQLSQAQYDQLTGGLSVLGVANPGSLPASAAQATYYGASDSFTNTSGVMSAYGSQMIDRDVDVKQTGSGITPMIGANISLADNKINVGLKYEFKTEMDITNETIIDQTGMFPDMQVTAADLPAFLSVGVDYQATEALKVSAGLHYYWDKGADYGKNGHDANGDYQRGDNSEFMDGNSYEIALGAEYYLNSKFALSAGYLYASVKPTAAYQSDLSYANNTSTIAFGGIYHISDRLNLDFGVLNTFYDTYTKDFTLPLNYTDTYTKTNFVASVGVTYRFGGAK